MFSDLEDEVGVSSLPYIYHLTFPSSPSSLRPKELPDALVKEALSRGQVWYLYLSYLLKMLEWREQVGIITMGGCRY